MKIGFDAKRAVKNMTGLGNYSRLVISRIAQANPDKEINLYSPADEGRPDISYITSLPNVRMKTPRAYTPGAFWRTFGLTKRLQKDDIDLFHGLSNELPVGLEHTRVASVLTMHDLIYRRLPDCYSVPDRLIYDIKYSRSCRRADRIIAISQRTRDDIVELYGISPDKIDVVYQGCQAMFYNILPAGEIDGILAKHDLRRGYILQVGTVEKRKNLELTIKAMAGIEDARLVVVGRGRDYLTKMKELANSLNITDRIKFLSDLATSELPAIYQGAGVIAYPSRYEGFGIPVIEGLASRRPVIAATGSCLEEAGGDAAFYVDPNSPRDMAEALKTALTGGEQIELRIAEGIKYIRRFNTADMGERILEVYRRAIASKKNG